MEEGISGNSENTFRSTNTTLLNDVKYLLAFTYRTFSVQVVACMVVNTHSECTRLNVCKGTQKFMLILLQKL